MYLVNLSRAKSLVSPGVHEKLTKYPYIKSGNNNNLFPLYVITDIT
jgi:hypothetical protein